MMIFDEVKLIGEGRRRGGGGRLREDLCDILKF